MNNLQQLINKIDNYFPMKVKDINSTYTLEELETACCPNCNIQFRSNKTRNFRLGNLNCSYCSISFSFDMKYFASGNVKNNFPLIEIQYRGGENILLFANIENKNAPYYQNYLLDNDYNIKDYSLIFAPLFLKHLKNKTLDKFEEDVKKLSLLK